WAVGQLAHGLVEERASGTQQSLGAADPLVRRVLGREGARGQHRGLGHGQCREGVDRIARDAERDRGDARPSVGGEVPDGGGAGLAWAMEEDRERPLLWYEKVGHLPIVTA